MRFRGGYNILVGGRPEDVVEALPEAKELYLPLVSNRTGGDSDHFDDYKAHGAFVTYTCSF
ncbi:MAG: hypothetical protein PHF37_04915 [Phycisphaerae bacterium]|nr:hypothetical protein [Phycisphaerae bacterium]